MTKEQIDRKIEEFKHNMTLEERCEIDFDWYEEAKKRAIVELSRDIKDARKIIKVRHYTVTVNPLVQKGHYEHDEIRDSRGGLYFKNDTLVDFDSEIRHLPEDVITAISQLGFRLTMDKNFSGGKI